MSYKTHSPKRFLPSFEKKILSNLDNTCSKRSKIFETSLFRNSQTISDDQTLKDSNKQLKDFVSYLKQSQSKSIANEFNFMQNEFENIKGALKKRLFLQKNKMMDSPKKKKGKCYNKNRNFKKYVY